VRVKIERDGDALVATPTGSQGSGIFSSLSRAGGLLVGPSAETLLKTGAQATVLLIGELDADGDDATFEGRRHSH